MRYQAVDHNGNYGNYTYVNISVDICPSLNCTNESNCNLICNSEMDYWDGNCTIPESRCVVSEYGMFSSTLCPLGDQRFHLPGWASHSGSPDFINDAVSMCTDNNTFTECRNYNSLPNSTGYRANFLAFKGQTQNNSSSYLAESISAYARLSPNKKYILSYHKSDGLDPSCSGTDAGTHVKKQNIGMTVVLDSIVKPFPQSIKYIHNPIDMTVAPDSNGDVMDFDNRKIPIFFDNNIGFDWSQTVVNFVAPNNEDYTFLTFYHAVDQSFITDSNDPTDMYYYLSLDRVELIEDRLEETPNTYTVHCGTSETVGIDLCTVANMQYEWWDVANNIQLTNGNTILNANPVSYYSVIGTNENGSQLSLSNIMSSVNLELRRVFPIALSNQNLPVFNHLDETSSRVAVTISVEDGGLPTDASFSYDVLNNNCLVYHFLAKNTYETHEWDFDGDGITDDEGVNPSYAFSIGGTYEITHTVHNECGSISYNESILVDCLLSQCEAALGYTYDLDNCSITLTSNSMAQNADFPIVSTTWDVEQFTTTSPPEVISIETVHTPTATIQLPDLGNFSATIYVITEDSNGNQCYVSESLFFEATCDNCQVPISSTAEILSDNVVKLNWNSIENAERYRVQYRPINNGSWTEVLTGDAETFYILNDLILNTDYECRIKTRCPSGWTYDWSELFYFTTASDYCDTPIDGEVINIDVNQVTLDWTRMAGDVKYKIKYKAPSSGQWNVQYVNYLPVLIDSLEGGTNYQYKVKTKCTSGWIENWSDSFYFTTNTTLGSRMIKTLEGFTFFPNPVSDFLQIQLDSDLVVQVELLNINGQVLESFEQFNSNLEVDVAPFSSGLYFVKVTQKDGQVLTKRFVKR